MRVNIINGVVNELDFVASALTDLFVACCQDCYETGPSSRNHTYVPGICQPE